MCEYWSTLFLRKTGCSHFLVSTYFLSKICCLQKMAFKHSVLHDMRCGECDCNHFLVTFGARPSLMHICIHNRRVQKCNERKMVQTKWKRREKYFSHREEKERCATRGKEVKKKGDQMDREKMEGGYETRLIHNLWAFVFGTKNDSHACHIIRWIPFARWSILCLLSLSHSLVVVSHSHSLSAVLYTVGIVFSAWLEVKWHICQRRVNRYQLTKHSLHHRWQSVKNYFFFFFENIFAMSFSSPFFLSALITSFIIINH